MNDLVKFLKEQKVKETGAFSKGVNKGLNIAISAIKNPQICPTIEQPQWVSVEDSLPAAEGEYLTYDADTGGHFNSFFDVTEEEFGEWAGIFDPFSLGLIDTEWRGYSAVTHWMPLPRPPKGGGAKMDGERKEDEKATIYKSQSNT